MKKIILLGSREAGSKNDVGVLAKDLLLTNKAVITVIYYEDLLFEISSTSQKISDPAQNLDLAEADFVIAFNWYKNGELSYYRDIAYTIAIYLDSKGIKFWNSEMIKQRSTTKLSGLMQMALAKIDIPATYFSLSPEILHSKAGDFPVVLKSIAASRGRNNFLVQSRTDLEKHAKTPNRLLMQEFIPNEGDYRVVCSAGEPVMAIYRQRSSQATHLNNTSAGGEATIVELSKIGDSALQASRQICKLMGRELAGIDFMRANDGSSREVFLEVNAIPQLTSGTFVNEKIQLLSESIANYLERKD